MVVIKVYFEYYKKFGNFYLMDQIDSLIKIEFYHNINEDAMLFKLAWL